MLAEHATAVAMLFFLCLVVQFISPIHNNSLNQPMSFTEKLLLSSEVTAT
jgi:hypothetical protein